MNAFPPHERITFRVIAICVFTVSCILFSSLLHTQNILVYNHASPNNTFSDPETHETVTPVIGITKALDSLGYSYTTVTSLPVSLEPYDVILLTLGWNC
jgi:hypothetical protein